LSSLPIGRPLAGNSILLLDAASELVPMGAEGEICVSGINVGIGYTDTGIADGGAFVGDPFHTERKMYRTGDMGRWLPGYLLAFTGRKDRQIKIRGFRIEPAEVEAVMKRLHYLDNVIVGEQRDEAGLNMLVAWIVPNGGWSEKTIKQHIREQLPSYMIPDRIIAIDHLPMTPNGKVDYRMLERFTDAGARAETHTPPANDIEHKLFVIWENALSKSDFGIHDSYFEIGGNSLSLIRVTAQIKEFYPEVAITDIFNYSTISEMAGYIVSLRSPDTLCIICGNRLKGRQTIRPSTARQVDAGQWIVAGSEWDLIKEGMVLPSGPSTDEEILMSFFCFALYEVMHNAVIQLVVLENNGDLYKGLITADFNSLHYREDLVLHIMQSSRNMKGSAGSRPLAATRLEKSADEIIVACYFDGMQDVDAIPSKDIDVLLRGGLARNGDLKISLIHSKKSISGEFARELLSCLIQITENLANT
jgi:hypothetical protein